MLSASNLETESSSVAWISVYYWKLNLSYNYNPIHNRKKTTPYISADQTEPTLGPFKH